MMTYKIVDNIVSVKNGDYYFRLETVCTFFGRKFYTRTKNVKCYCENGNWRIVDLQSGKSTFLGIYDRELAIEAQLNSLGFPTKQLDLKTFASYVRVFPFSAKSTFKP